MRNSISLSTCGEPLATAAAPASDQFSLFMLAAAPVFAIGPRVECLAAIVAQPATKRNVDQQSPFRSDKVAANARQADRKFLIEGARRELNVVQTLETHKRERANGETGRQTLDVLSKNGDLTR